MGTTWDSPPAHRWRGDDLGHNCADCKYASIYRCDRAAHDAWKQNLRQWLAGRAEQGDTVAAVLLPGVEAEIAAEEEA